MTRKQELVNEIMGLAKPDFYPAILQDFLGRLSLTVLLNVRDHLRVIQGS